MEKFKVIHNNKVAVAITDKYGAGWSTWSNIDPMDGRINKLLVEGRYVEALQVAKELYPNEGITTVTHLEIVWVEVGRQFIIEEYDGLESILYADNLEWVTA